MNKITTIGLDLAKNIFHVVGCDVRGKRIKRKQLSRGQVLVWFAQLPACLVGMEACAGSHYWARELKKLGHEVRLIPAQHVKAYVRGNKNDYNDAAAIAEAVTRPDMRFVSVKSPAQQDIQALHRLRAGRRDERTALCNQLRGLLGEYGLTVPQGVTGLRRRIPEILEDASNGLSDFFRVQLEAGYRHLQVIHEMLEYYTGMLKDYHRRDADCQRLQTAPGYGAINASAFASLIGDGSAYARGRDVSASLGIVPRQHSTGGKPRLLGISKRGDRYVRSLLIHGARAVVKHAEGKDDPLSQWVNRIRVRRGYNKATVAMANKMARIGWAILRNKTAYQADYAMTR